MAVNCSPFGPKPQFEVAAGTPASGYQLFFYVGGSVNTKQDTYTDSTGSTANSNPIVLNTLGQPANEIWFTAGQSYKVVYAPPTDTDPPTSPIWTVDNLRGINDTTVAQTDWISGPAPTYISAVSFSLAGDQTSTFAVGRRLKTTNSGGTIYSTITASAYAALTTVTVVNDSGTLDAGLSAVSYGLIEPANTSLPNSQAVRNTIGLGSAINIASATALPLSTSLGNLVRVTGTTPTTSVTMSNGQQVTCIADGAWPLTYDVTNMPLPGSASYTCAAGDLVTFYKDNGGVLSIRITKRDGTPVIAEPSLFDVDASVAANAMTLTINPCSIKFRSTTLTDGTPVTRNISAGISMTVSSGSTLGTTSAVQSDIAILAIDNAGTVEVAVVNIAGGTDLSETGLISTTAEGGAGAADSATVIYSTTARTNVAYRVVGIVRSTQATAGTWATTPSLVQGAGGTVLTSMSSLGYGQTWQNVAGSRSYGTTYYNTTGKPIAVSVSAANGSAATQTITVGGVVAWSSQVPASGGNYAAFAIVPPGASYVVAHSAGTALTITWAELR